jgi:hypothetical protein
MGHPEFFEQRFHLCSIRFSSGVARSVASLPGSAGCPCRGSGVPEKLFFHHFFFSLLAACGGEEKGEKEFFGVTPNPGRDATLPAPAFFEQRFEKRGMTHEVRAPQARGRSPGSSVPNRENVQVENSG